MKRHSQPSRLQSSSRSYPRSAMNSWNAPLVTGKRSISNAASSTSWRPCSLSYGSWTSDPIGYRPAGTVTISALVASPAGASGRAGSASR